MCCLSSGVGYNSIHCNGCKLWVLKKCSGLQQLAPNPDYRCARCMGIARPIDGRPQSEVQVGPDKLEVVASFCYLGDMLSAGGGYFSCENSLEEAQGATTSSHIQPPLLQDLWRCIQLCVRSAMLFASETWLLTKPNLQRLQGNDRAMIRQICSIKSEDVATVRSSELLAKLEDHNLILREKASLVWARGAF